MDKSLNHRKQGFALIELLVVVSLLVIILCLNLGQGGKHIDSLRLRQGTRQLAMELRFLQNKAIVEEKTYLIRFIGADYEWGYLIRHTNDDGFFDDQRIYKTLPTGIKIEYFSGPTKELYMYPTGAPSCGVTIRLINKRGQSGKLTVVPVTGRVEIKKE